METTTSLKTFEVTIPEKYADILKKFITSLEGKVKAQKKSGLDEALEDVKAGRIYHAESTKDLMKQILDCGNAISKEIADMEPRRHGANLAFHRYRNAFRPILR